jgi:hypothetical protein
MPNFAGSQATRTGAYDPNGTGNNVIRATLTTTPVAICGSGSQLHVGTFRHKVRVYGSGTGPIYARLAWKEGASPRFRENDWVEVPGQGAFYELDLGLMSIPEAALGVQTCEWRYEAYSETPGDTLDIDYGLVIPTPLGKVRTPLELATPTVFSARDEFDQASGALTGKNLPSGQTWTVGTGSDADDFSVLSTPIIERVPGSADANEHTGRFVSIGTASYGAIAVQADLTHISPDGIVGAILGGTYARWVDINNWIIGVVRWDGPTNSFSYVVRKRIGGTVTTLASVPIPQGTFPTSPGAGAAKSVVLIVEGSRWYLADKAGSMIDSGSESDLPASGRIGVVGATTASGIAAGAVGLDSVAAWVPEIDRVLHANRSMEIRSDAVIRESATAGKWGPVESTGSYLKLPPAGREGRVSRVVVKARRNDVDELPDDQIADGLKVTLEVTPRVLLL